MEEDFIDICLRLCAQVTLSNKTDVTKAIEKASEIQENAQAASKTQRLKFKRLRHWESPATIAVRLGCAYRDGAKKMVMSVALGL